MKLLSPSKIYEDFLLRTGWYRLEKREKIMVSGLIIFVAIFLLYSLLLAPLLSDREKLQKSLAAREEQLQEIVGMREEYRLQQSHSNDIQSRIEKRPQGFTLFSFIEQMAAAADVKQNIKYLKPSEVEGEGVLQESRVDMKLERISTERLVKFLEGLESEANVIYVNRISIKDHGKDEGYMDVVIQVITFHTKAEGV